VINIELGKSTVYVTYWCLPKLPKIRIRLLQISPNRAKIGLPWKPRPSLDCQPINDFIAGKDDARSQLSSTGQIMLAPITATELSNLPYRYPPRILTRITLPIAIVPSKYVGDIPICWPTICERYFGVSYDYFTD
jgi:hypothetical protein